jgi:linearmycin/streptolysin S transport system permease protein
MYKLFLIAVKDVKLAFRDRTATILMLLAPFLLALGLGFVTGRFSGGASNGISPIPVILVNQDGKQLGNALEQLFHSESLCKLVASTVHGGPADACSKVDENKALAAIVIPAGFTDSIIPRQGQPDPGKPVRVELYTNPTAAVKTGVIRAILTEFLSRVESGRVGREVALRQLVASGRILVQEAREIGPALGLNAANTAGSNASVRLKHVTTSGETAGFDVLGLLAPGMALMFLMYTASYGGRTLLDERTQGTLPRLLVSPTNMTQVLGGKIFGTFLTGLVQVSVLILTFTLLFRLKWGDPIGVLVLVPTAVFAAVGWGMLITAVAKTPSQVSNMGAAVMLLFGLLGGSFFNLRNTPGWFQLLSKITPNAWGLDGFNTLAMGGSLSDILRPLLALVAMGIVLFSVAGVLFHSRGIAEQ